MKIEVVNRDYIFHVSREQLINLINKGSKLENTLLKQEFTLERDMNLRSAEGIETYCLPDGSNFGNADNIIIKVSPEVLERVRRGELVNAKYDEHNCLSICKYDSKW